MVTQKKLEKITDFFLPNMKISVTAGRKIEFTTLIPKSACMYSIEKRSRTLRLNKFRQRP